MKEGDENPQRMVDQCKSVCLWFNDLVMWTATSAAGVRFSLNSETPIMAMTTMVNAFAEKENPIHDNGDATTVSWSLWCH